MRTVVTLAAALAFALAFAQPGFAQEARTSADPIADAQGGLERDCGTVDYDEAFASRPDLDGDGRQDVIISYSIGCDGAYGMFCGSAGCLTETWYQRPDGRFALALSENIYGAEPVTFNGRPALRISMHGMACERAGAEGCTVIAVWTGERLETLSKG